MFLYTRGYALMCASWVFHVCFMGVSCALYVRCMRVVFVLYVCYTRAICALYVCMLIHAYIYLSELMFVRLCPEAEAQGPV